MSNTLTCRLKEFLHRHEISEDLAFSLLIPPLTINIGKRHKYKHLISKIYNHPESVSIFNKELRILAGRANLLLGFDIPPNQGKSFFSVVLHAVSTLFAVILAPIAIIGLLHLILSGASNLSINYGVPAIAVFAIFICLMLLLAALEGSQISIVSLRTKDLSGIKKEFPTTAEIQNKTKKTYESQKYLAGRQFFVIFVVFLIAQSTSFPNAINFMPPFVSEILITLPILDLALLKLGFLGAFVTLWFGQLAPQFYANKNPQAMLNVVGMKLVVELCFLFESIGFARPGSWLVTHLKPGSPIAVSNREEFENVTQDVGYQTLLQEYLWHVTSSEEWTLDYQNVTGFTSAGITQIKEDGLEVKGTSLLPEFFNVLNLAEDDQGSVYSEGAESTRLGEGWHSYSQILKPTHGSFGVSETVVSKIYVKGNDKVALARLSVTRPTKLIRMKWIASNEISYLSPITVRKYKYDDTIDLLRLISEEVINISQTSDDNHQWVEEYIETYPKIGTYYEFSWEYN